MLFFTTSFLLYVVLFLSFMFLMFYVWRRVHGLEKYTNILEKKIVNLKKENKGLQELAKNPDTTSFDEAEVVMNSVFKCSRDDMCYMEMEEEACAAKKCSTRIEEIEELTSEDPIQEPELPELPELPVAEHKEDVESVISDSNVFTKKKLNKMNLDKIKDICTSLDLSTEGTKGVLIERILSQ